MVLREIILPSRLGTTVDPIRARTGASNSMLARRASPGFLLDDSHCKPIVLFTTIMACKMDWKKLPMSLTELCIDTTLRCGQSFRYRHQRASTSSHDHITIDLLHRWRQDADKVWSCALHGRILSLRQDSEHLHYRAIYPSIPPITSAPSSEPSQVAPSIPRNDEGTLALIKHYFNLEHNLTQLYEEWASADTNFKKKAPKFTGVRILRQDAWEALVGFICSSNNNIQRISQMVEKLCLNYGPLVGHVGSQPFHDFPSVEALTDPQVEQHLRQLGFGYRAKYLYQTAVIVQDKPPGWLEGLRNPETRFDHTLRQSAGEFIAGGREGYREAHEELLQLQGVGPKVADCVSLMGLGWGESVPVDTHGEKWS